MRQDKSVIISVIGGAAASAKMLIVAEEVGRRIAEQGAVLVCGGLGGVMEAACKGAYEAGGMTIGILPGLDSHAANAYVKIPVATGMGVGRNIAVVRTGHAVIAIDGSYGTLSEMAFALQFGMPLVGINTWQMSSGEQEQAQYIEATSAAEAVAKAFAAIENE
ncbi:TIGR00725 family protein [Chloroflexota bacterium]